EDRTSATNLIINYLPQDMTDRELYNLFSSCGSINTCKIMRDYKTGYSFGYGFVDYNSEADSEDAILKLNGFYVRNKRLKVSYARPGGQSIKDTNLYVINLSRNINDDQLDRIFSPYGLIVQRNILRDKLTGRPRGVAFVRYNKREEAQEAIKALNNTVPEGGSQPIWVRLAEEHGKAKAAQFMSQIAGGPHMGPPQQQPPPHHMNPHMQQQQQAHQHHSHHHNGYLTPTPYALAPAHYAALPYAVVPYATTTTTTTTTTTSVHGGSCVYYHYANASYVNSINYYDHNTGQMCIMGVVYICVWLMVG
ncbi:sister-of-Sex-lethal, partial [Drosophila virilis]